jgi:O-antigen/teichoic acid export membrane protein
MISKKFISSSFIYSVIGSLPLASSFILLPFYTNLLSTNDYGLLALYISIALLVQVISNLALDTTIGVHYFEFKDAPEKLKKFIGTIAGVLLVSAVVFILFSLVGGKLLFSKLFPENDLKFYPYGFLSILTGIFNSFFKTYTNLLINQERPTRYFWSNIITFILTICLSLAGLYYFPNSLIGPIWGRFLSSLIIFMVSLYFFKTEFEISLNLSLLRGLLSFCLPVFAFFIITWIISSLDRFIIKAFMQSSDVGIYDFIVKCTLIIDFVLNGLSSAVTPKIFNILKNKKITSSTTEMNHYFNGFTFITLLLVPFIVVIIPLVIPVIVKKHDYYAGFQYVSLLGLGFLARSLYLMYIIPLYYFKQTISLPIALLGSAIIQISLSVLGIKEFGIIGAVWANFLSRPLQALFLYFAARRVFIFRFNLFKQLYLPIFYVVITIISYFIFREEHLIQVYGIQMIIVYIAIAFVFRKELPTLIDTFLGSRYLNFIPYFSKSDKTS